MQKIKPPHEIKIVNNMPRLVRENFTAEFRMKGEIPVQMQDGVCFDASGDVMANPKSWVWAEYDKLPDETKARLKMNVPTEKIWEPKVEVTKPKS